MQGYVAVWRDITKLSDDAAAAMICDDRIDILIDLSGHTGGHRLQLFLRKPSPVQVSWLGYFNTTGVKAIDYLISDETTIPPEEEQWFSEQIFRLPGSRFCYAPPEYAPPVTAPPVMTSGFITFGSFNNIAKLTPEVIELWSRVLIAIPDSKLIIKWSTLRRKKVRDRLLRQFARHGVSEERLVLRVWSPHADMLREYGDIDIILDPFPFSGGMTSCEALWMGVPVLTLLGDKPAGRQTAGFLRTIGLPEWVTMSPEQFVTRAKEAASDHDELNTIRFGLRERMIASTLCDGVSFTRNLEAAYRTMWKAWISR
jgi:predicted O-linked N-acetylglucosamine transferase (SPINDLY family)